MNFGFPEPEESTPALPEPSGPQPPEADAFYQRPSYANGYPTGIPQASNGVGYSL
jgi:hypothetical protein